MDIDDDKNNDLEENAGLLLDDSIFEDTDVDILSDEMVEDMDEEDDLDDDDEEIFDELDLLAQEEEEDELDFYNDEDDF